MTTPIKVERESKVLIELTVYDSAGAVVTSGYQVCIVADGTRPTGWADPDTSNGRSGILIGPGSANVLIPGPYRAYSKTTATPEIPVIEHDPVIYVN